MRVAKRNEESKRSSRRCIFGGGFAFPSLPVALGFGENQDMKKRSTAALHRCW